jgi:hypothetical protein
MFSAAGASLSQNPQTSGPATRFYTLPEFFEQKIYDHTMTMSNQRQRHEYLLG